MKIYYIPSKEFDEVKERLEKAEETIRGQRQSINILSFAGVFVLIIALLKGCMA